MFPMSLFAQVQSLPMADNGAEVRKWFDKILSDHTRQGSPHYIYDLALGEVATVDANTGAITLAQEQLNVIKDYFSYFGNIFVGTVGIPHPDPYGAGILDGDFRWRNIYASREAAVQYVQYLKDSALNNIPVHWYITYEANLNALVDDGIKEAYKAYIKQLTEDLTHINNNDPDISDDPAFLWSPAFWTPFRNISEPEKH